MWLGLVWGYGPLSFLHPFQGPLRLAPQSFTYNLKLRDWRRIEVENFDAFIYFTWFLDFSLFPSFYKFPNSPGEVFVRGIRDASLFGAASGSFSLSTDSTSWESAMPSGSSSARYKLSLNLAGGNNTFGSASTVQPSALRTLVLIRAY